MDLYKPAQENENNVNVSMRMQIFSYLFSVMCSGSSVYFHIYIYFI